MKNIIFFFTLLMLIGCSSKDNINILCGQHHKYWYVNYNKFRKYNDCYYFDKSNKWIVYLIDKDGNIEKQSLFIEQERWSLSNDTLLFLDDSDPWFIKTIEDTLILLQQDTNVLKLTPIIINVHPNKDNIKLKESAKRVFLL